MRKIIANFLMAILILGSLATTAQANQTLSNGVVIDQQGTFSMSQFGMSREVQNNHGAPFFVPTTSRSEWLAFLRYPPSGVQTDATCSGDRSGYEYEECPNLYRGNKRRLVTVDYQCSPFDSDYDNAEPPPPPQYGPWVDSCSYCVGAAGCSDGEGRQDYCAQGHYEKRTNTYACPTATEPGRTCSYDYDVYVCDRYDYYCYDNCHTTPKCNENLNQQSVSICPSAPWINGAPAVIRTPTCYGNATGLNISTYVEYPGHCGDGYTRSCRQSVQTSPLECPTGYDTIAMGEQQRTIYAGNNCSAAPSAYTVTRAPQCAPKAVCNEAVTTRAEEFNCPAGQVVTQERRVRETRYERNVCDAPLKTEVYQAGACGTPGSCGASNGTTSTTAPTSGLCGAGSATTVTKSADGNSWVWSCSGTNGAPAASCSANIPATPACGSANGTYYASAPGGSALCSSGGASGFTQSNPWKWYCEAAGDSAEYSDACYNAAYGHSCGSSGGVSGRVERAGGQGWYYCDYEQNGQGPQFLVPECLDSPVACETAPSGGIVNGTCGPANGTSRSTAPTTDLCISGTATGVSDTGSGWSWQCLPTGAGTTASCSATKAAGQGYKWIETFKECRWYEPDPSDCNGYYDPGTTYSCPPESSILGLGERCTSGHEKGCFEGSRPEYACMTDYESVANVNGSPSPVCKEHKQYLAGEYECNVTTQYSGAAFGSAERTVCIGGDPNRVSDYTHNACSGTSKGIKRIIRIYGQ